MQASDRSDLVQTLTDIVAGPQPIEPSLLRHIGGGLDSDAPRNTWAPSSDAPRNTWAPSSDAPRNTW